MLVAVVVVSVGGLEKEDGISIGMKDEEVLKKVEKEVEREYEDERENEAKGVQEYEDEEEGDEDLHEYGKE